MRQLVLALALALTSAAPAPANDYSAVGAYAQSVDYIDLGTVTTDGDSKTFWAYTVYLRTNDLGIDWTSQRVTVDCKHDRLVTLAVIGYGLQGDMVANTEDYPNIRLHWIDIPRETEAAAKEDAVCHGKVIATENGASFLDIAPIARRRLAQIAERRSQEGSVSAPASMSKRPAWRAILQQVGRALQETSTPVSTSSYNEPSMGLPVYSASECVGPIVMGVCHGTILPTQATHPVCYGEMLNGACTGPMF